MNKIFYTVKSPKNKISCTVKSPKNKIFVIES